MAVVRLAMLEPLLPIDDIVEKLEAIEARLGGGPQAGSGGIERAAGQGRPASRGGATPGATPGPRPAPRGRAAEMLPEESEPTEPESRSGPVVAAPPAPSASADAGPAAAGTVPWRDFLALVQQERKALYMTLAGSRCLDLGAQELRIGVASEVYARELSKKENRDEIEALAARAFGRPLSVSVQAVKEASPGNEVGAAAAARETEESFKRETLAHPVVKAALDILGGEVRAVKRRR